LKFNGNVTLDNTGAGGNAFTAPTGLAGLQLTSGFTCAGTASLDCGQIAAGFVQAANNLRTLTVAGNTLTLAGLLATGTDSAGTTRVDGGLIKSGAGQLILAGLSDYTGNTMVSNGVLRVNGSLGNSAVTVQTNAILGGSGVIHGPLTVELGGTLQPGAGTNLATLTVSNTVHLAGITWLQLNRTNVQTTDRLAVSALLNLGGTLIVTNVGPTNFAAGDTFTLFTAGSFTNNFGSTNLPPLAPGLSWNTSQLAVNGTIAVAAPAGTNPPVFFAPFASGNNVVLGGSNGAAGNPYFVLTTTNLKLPRTNWTVLATNIFGPDGQFTFTNPINPTQPNQFFILQLP
jgi:autotransporter-associated beta strand protein